MASLFTDPGRMKAAKATEVPASAGGLSRMSTSTHCRAAVRLGNETQANFCGPPDFDLEIRKRFAQPLAVESGEFPDVSNIEARMLPFCYEAGLASGHAPEAAQFMSIATETFIKEVLTAVFSRTRSNGPGDSGSAGFGPNSNWIQTHKYRRQLRREEEAFQRGEVTRDKSGLLPVEAKAASERGPLGIADLRLALEMGDCGLANFPVITRSVIYGYREGELENWDDYTYVDGRERVVEQDEEDDVEMGGVNGTGTGTGTGTGKEAEPLTNGVDHGDQMDIDSDMWWEGAEPADGDFLNGVLDSCLAVG